MDIPIESYSVHQFPPGMPAETRAACEALFAEAAQFGEAYDELVADTVHDAESTDSTLEALGWFDMSDEERHGIIDHYKQWQRRLSRRDN